MKVILADHAGFCFGVKRAVELTEAALSDGPVYCMGDLIHNRDVVSLLREKGLITVQNAEEVPEGERVVIRSHGIMKCELETLRKRGCVIIDATCPRVSRIHRIAAKAEEEECRMIVFGEPAHPEVQGICGWCTRAAVVRDDAEFRDWASENMISGDTEITVVFQTTSNKQSSEKFIDSLKKEYTNIHFFDTICDATSVRQAEAAGLSAACDIMVVVGGTHSANSIHLAEICRQMCKDVRFVEGPDALSVSDVPAGAVVGVTAGASTPSWIIKEVVNKMNETDIRNDETMEAPAPAEVPVEEVTAAEAAPVEEAPADAEAPAAEEEASTAEAETPAAEAEVPAAEAESPVGEAEAPAQEEAAAPAEKGEMTFDELLEESIKTIYNGDTVTGVVAAIGSTEITIELPTKHSGYISVSEFTNDQPGVDVNELVKIGDEIQATVVRVNDVEGTVQLSKRRLDAARNWSDVEAAAEAGTVLEGKVSEENKGGVVINLKGIRVFIPASQTDLGRDVPMTELVGKTVRFKITEVNRGRRRVVGSIRQVAARERREKAEKIWSEIEIGKKYNGVVKSMTSYGAFVDIGGVDGMVHVSEISWKRIRKPDDVLSVGDEVEVYVIGFDPEKKKISLGYRKDEDNPWKKFTDTYKEGDVANVKVVKFMPFGAFAEIVPGVDGLIHISQIANRRIGKPEEELTVGQFVDAKITAIDNEKQKVSLSIRALIEPAPAPARERVREERVREPEGDALVYEISATGEAKGFAPEEDEIAEED